MLPKLEEWEQSGLEFEKSPFYPPLSLEMVPLSDLNIYMMVEISDAEGEGGILTKPVPWEEACTEWKSGKMTEAGV